MLQHDLSVWAKGPPKRTSVLDDTTVAAVVDGRLVIMRDRYIVDDRLVQINWQEVRLPDLTQKSLCWPVVDVMPNLRRCIRVGEDMVKQPFNPTCFSTTTTEASPKPPPDGRYRPTVSTNSSALLSQLSFIAESPNKNDTELTEISHSLRFETDCNIPVLTILQRFIEQVLLLDNNAYLLSKDKKRHFVSVADIPTAPTKLQQTFPATILNRRSGNRLVLRITMCCTKSFLELTQLGLVTWANRKKFCLETDIYNKDDVRDCLWIAGRDSKTSTTPSTHQVPDQTQPRRYGPPTIFDLLEK